MEIIILIWLMCIGAILGSFLGCMGYRIPKKIKTTYPSSFCPNCKKSLKWLSLSKASFTPSEHKII